MKPLSRRTFLKGAGTFIAIPFLDAMVPAFAKSAPKSPARMMYVYAPSGMIPRYWNPTTTGRDFEYQRIMKPLEKFRSDILVMSGLSRKPLGLAMNDGGGDHARAVASYLTGVRPKKTLGADFHAGVSADQIAARVLGQKTRFSSLELACEDSRTVGACDSYTCAYQTISWKSPTQPLPPEINPRALFECLFGSAEVSDDPTERSNQQVSRRSILDLTRENTKDLMRMLGPTDRRKMDEYLTSIRETERRLEKSHSNPHALSLPAIGKPSGIPADYAEHARLMFDLLTIALQTDMTRVGTFMMAREGGVRPYPEIGVPEAHHPLTHHRGNPEMIEKVTKIECYHMEQFAYFVAKLKSIQEGDGTLLDHSAIVYGASMAEPNGHDNCPTLIAGSAGGRIKTGQHIACEKSTPIANLHLSMLDLVGVPTDKLGNSNGKLDFLTGIT